MALRPKKLESADRHLARSVLWIALAIYTLTFGGGPGDLDRDAELSYQATRALAYGDGLRITDETPGGATLLAEGSRVRPVDGGGSGVALVEPLPVVLGVPFFLLGAQFARVFPTVEEIDRETTPGFAGARDEYWSRLFVGWSHVLFASLAAWLVCLSCLRLGASRPAAWIGSVLLVTTTFLWPASSSWVPSAASAFFAAFTLHAALRIRSCFYELSAAGPWHWVVLGVALGGAAACEPVFAPAAVVVAISAVRMSVRGRKRLWSMPLLKGEAGVRRSFFDVALLLLPFTACAALMGWGSAQRGEPFLAAYTGVEPFAGDAGSNWVAELAGLAASPGKGLVWLAPCLLLAVFGYARLRREPRLVTLTGWVPLVGALGAAAWGGWADLRAFEPLALAPVLVLVWPAVVLGIDQLREHGGGRWLVAALAVLGLVANLGGLIASRGAFRTLADHTAVELFDLEPSRPFVRPHDDLPGRILERRVAWDWRTAAPWVGWRLVRHRAAAAQGDFAAEVFPLIQVVLVEEGAPVRIEAERDRGFHQFAWHDLEQRLGGPVWPVLLLVIFGLGAGAVGAAVGLDPTKP